MRNQINLVLLFIIALVVYLFVQNPIGLGTISVINIHESVEQSSDIDKLRTVMNRLHFDSSVLTGIPLDFLYYTEGNVIDVTDVGRNHEHIINASKKYPDEIQFACAVDPIDPLWKEKLNDCFNNGSVGAKVYSGYSYSYQGPLDDPELADFYETLVRQDSFLILPINLELYQSELESILTNHPDLVTICPHYCLSSQDLGRLSGLLDKYPNLYVDSSFGFNDFMVTGLLQITAHHDEFRDFYMNYSDRILFATDAVITTYEGKGVDEMTRLYTDYVAVLSSENLFPSQLDNGVLYRGLGLPREVLLKVFRENWLALTD